jgi:ribosomal protein S25
MASLSSHRRLSLLEEVVNRGSVASIGTLAAACGMSVGLASQHVRRLHFDGLVKKRARKRRVELFPTKRASTLLELLHGLSNRTPDEP